MPYKNAIVLIVLEPSEIYLDFLTAFAQGPTIGTAFAQYDIYIIIDSKQNQTAITHLDKYKNLNFIQIGEQQCINHGYKNVNFIGVNKLISGWDKALLYFSVIMPEKYDHVWFIEDDVFFLKEQLLINLDRQYPNQDLIANCDFDETTVTTNKSINKDWLWKKIDIEIPKPHYAGMMCITRMSNKLLQCIRWYAATYKTLFFLEALFPTITEYFNLTHACPCELKTVTYRDPFFDEESDTFYGDLDRVETHFFHPIKDQNKHKELRSKYLK